MKLKVQPNNKEDNGAANNGRDFLVPLPDYLSKTGRDIIEYYNETASEFANAIHFEKTTIIGPALIDAFKRAVKNDQNFDMKTHRMVDIGCGPLYLSLPFIREGIQVDGIDASWNMLLKARDTLKNAKFQGDVKSVTLVTDTEELKEGEYNFAMMNFVHQCASSREELKQLFDNAAKLLAPGSTFVLTGAHPKYLHVPHAVCEYDVADSNKLEDGHVYSGRLFNPLGAKMYNLEEEYFWSQQTLMDVAKEAGFTVDTVENIEDKGWARQASEEPAYIMMTFHKNGVNGKKPDMSI